MVITNGTFYCQGGDPIEQILLSQIENLADERIEKQLLPGYLWPRDNTRRMRHLGRALENALEVRLTPVQRRHIHQHYWQNMSKSEIARNENTSCSAISKSVKAAHSLIREYVDMYMNIYDRLEREIIDEEG